MRPTAGPDSKEGRTARGARTSPSASLHIIRCIGTRVGSGFVDKTHPIRYNERKNTVPARQQKRATAWARREGAARRLL